MLICASHYNAKTLSPKRPLVNSLYTAVDKYTLLTKLTDLTNVFSQKT